MSEPFIWVDKKGKITEENSFHLQERPQLREAKPKASPQNQPKGPRITRQDDTIDTSSSLTAIVSTLSKKKDPEIVPTPIPSETDTLNMLKQLQEQIQRLEQKFDSLQSHLQQPKAVYCNYYGKNGKEHCGRAIFSKQGITVKLEVTGPGEIKIFPQDWKDLEPGEINMPDSETEILGTLELKRSYYWIIIADETKIKYPLHLEFNF